MDKKDKTILTFGTFDLFHVGHLRLLQRAKKCGGRLVVGVSTDALNRKKKNKNCIIPQDQRMEIVNALSCVDEVFSEESLSKKPDYIRQTKADILVMGNDWEGKFDHLMPRGRVLYLKRTNFISTSFLIEHVSTQ